MPTERERAETGAVEAEPPEVAAGAAPAMAESERCAAEAANPGLPDPVEDRLDAGVWRPFFERVHWRSFPLLAFAWVSYALFARSTIYLVGFVGNVYVPQQIDGPRGVDLAASAPAGGALSSIEPRALLINLALLLVFALHHSILARKSVKRWVVRVVPPALERSSYVLVSSLLLILLMWQWRPLPAPVWVIDARWARTLMWTSFALGWTLALLSSFRLGHSETFGVRPVLRRFQGRHYEPRGVERRAMYSIIRHPMYLGFLLGIWSTPSMSIGHLELAVVLTLYLALGRRWEERDLLSRYGAAYREYRDRVPAMVPRWRR